MAQVYIGLSSTLVIAGTKFVSFLTPEMASKNDASHGIDYSVLGYLLDNPMLCLASFFDAMYAVKKLATLYLQSLDQLRQTNLQMYIH